VTLPDFAHDLLDDLGQRSADEELRREHVDLASMQDVERGGSADVELAQQPWSEKEEPNEPRLAAVYKKLAFAVAADNSKPVLFRELLSVAPVVCWVSLWLVQMFAAVLGSAEVFANVEDFEPWPGLSVKSAVSMLLGHEGHLRRLGVCSRLLEAC
jgi:hypothetical protein